MRSSLPTRSPGWNRCSEREIAAEVRKLAQPPSRGRSGSALAEASIGRGSDFASKRGLFGLTETGLLPRNHARGPFRPGEAFRDPWS